MVLEFFIITLAFLAISLFLCPFIVLCMISIGVSENIVDFIYWGVVIFLWLIELYLHFRKGDYDE